MDKRKPNDFSDVYVYVIMSPRTLSEGIIGDYSGFPLLVSYFSFFFLFLIPSQHSHPSNIGKVELLKAEAELVKTAVDNTTLPPREKIGTLAVINETIFLFDCY